MSARQRIVIWDLSAERLRDMEINVKAAMRRLGLKAVVQLNSEEPLLSRHGLIGHTPAVQVNGGKIWRSTPGLTVSEKEFVHLFRMLMEENQLYRESLL